MLKNVSVVGAGTMGNGIAHVFAMHGHQVTLVDVSEQALEKALSTIEKNLDRMLSKGSITEADKAATLSSIQTSTSLAAGVGSADLVVEAATERVELKLKIFKTSWACHFGFKYLVHFNYQNCFRNQSAQPGHWNAFHESGAGYEVG